MSTLNRDMVFLVLQFLGEEKFMESVHRLEKESGLFFNTEYFDEKIIAGEWEEVENYLSGFTKVTDNRYSTKIYFEIRKQKYLEALDRKDKAKALEMLVEELKVFSTYNEDVYKDLTQLLTLQDVWENAQVSMYRNIQNSRSILLAETKRLIKANPLFGGKLASPTLTSSRLRILINQSLNWQHTSCNNPKENPDFKTLFTDHKCEFPKGPLAPPPVNQPASAPGHCDANALASWMATTSGANALASWMATTSGANALASWMATTSGANALSSWMATTSGANALASWMATTSGASALQGALTAPANMPLPQNQVSILKRPRTPPATLGIVDYQNPDHQLMKRLRPTPSTEEVTSHVPRQQAPCSLQDLPTKAALTLHQGSTVTSMEFHPKKNTLLLVGSATGEIALWELIVRERLVCRPFKIWDMSNCSHQFQDLIAKETPISVTHVAWSPDGNFIGVAYTKHLIHLYAFSGTNDLRQHTEIDAHVGAVNDLAFAIAKEQLIVVTCGDDKLIKVWDVSGQKHFTFEGHNAPVYSICLHERQNNQIIFSTAIDGKIKFWLYDDLGSRIDYDAPGKWCTTMLYSADGTRLFSCGTSEDGDTFLVEWNADEGSIKRTYLGFLKKSGGVVQFDTSKNRFLAVGEDGQIKFWDVDNINVLTSTDAEGGLLAFPRLRFNREGNLLAVNTADNGFKILANPAGFQSLRFVETPTFETMRTPVASSVIKAIEVGLPKSRIDDSTDKPKPWQLVEIWDPDQCRQATLPDTAGHPTKFVRLLYTNSGVGILALGSNGIQRLWKWASNEQNPNGKATATIAPQPWQPKSGLLMTNDVSGVNLEEATPCIALSKNDAYVMAAAGGKVSLFNSITFKVLITFMAPPPASTFLAFHPLDNNIIAIGMEDSTIHIYHFRLDQVKSKLEGHLKRITGLAFSTTLNVLVSSGADAWISFWNINTWEKRRSVVIRMPTGKAAIGDIQVQFHVDQIRILAVHETQLALIDGSKMELIRQYIPQDSLFGPISSAVYACNSQLIYTAFRDGYIRMFDADSFVLRCRIAPSAYFPPGSQGLSPVVIAAHPKEPNQFAVGMSDGSIKVIEPSEAEGNWGMVSTSEAINTSSSTISNQNQEHLQK